MFEINEVEKIWKFATLAYVRTTADKSLDKNINYYKRSSYLVVEVLFISLSV